MWVRHESTKSRKPLDFRVVVFSWLTLSFVLVPRSSPFAVDRAHQAQPSASNYPAHWWTPAPRDGAPDWEILPQDAGPGEVILSKRNELGLLSNFAATPFTFRGRRYASLEGFWQMMKYPEGNDDPRATAPGVVWQYTREQVGQMTGFEAKRAGTLADNNM